MKKQMKIVAVLLFICGLLAAVLWANHDRPRFTVTKTSGVEYETAKVLSVIEDQTVVDTNTEGIKKGSTKLEIEILTGRYKGTHSFVTNYYSALYNVDVGEGDTVSVRIDTTDVNVFQVSIYNYNRVPLVLGLVCFFALLLAIVGGWQGVKAFLGLAYTVFCIVYLLLPLTLKGVPPIPLTCFIITMTSAVCFFFIGGVQKKTIAAALGCLCGVVAAAFIGTISASLGGVTVFQMEEAEALLLTKSDFPIQLRGLFTSGILIAAVGAVMDIAMSIASALEEVHILNPARSKKELFFSGMKIGRDAMGTMANTLVLAYVGSSLNMMILIYSYGVSFQQLMNTDFVAIELIQAIAGSCGIILTVPCVSAISAWLFGSKESKNLTNF